MWEFILSIADKVIAGLIILIVPNALRYVRQHVFLSQALLWKIDHREGSAKDEAETLIQLRNAGKVSIDNYPISIKFNLRANIIETYCHIIPPEKKYNPLQEDRQLRKRWMRAYTVYLDPQDILQISIKSTGQHVGVPQLSVRNDSIDQSLKSILFAADDAQFTLTKLAVKEPLQLLALIYTRLLYFDVPNVNVIP